MSTLKKRKIITVKSRLLAHELIALSAYEVSDKHVEAHEPEDEKWIIILFKSAVFTGKSANNLHGQTVQGPGQYKCLSSIFPRKERLYTIQVCP